MYLKILAIDCNNKSEFNLTVRTTRRPSLRLSGHNNNRYLFIKFFMKNGRPAMGKLATVSRGMGR